MHASNWYARTFKPACAAAGLPGIRFHDLRHTFASTVIASGATALAVKEWMGHSTIAVTYDVYGHLFHADTEQIVAGIDAQTAPLRRAS